VGKEEERGRKRGCSFMFWAVDGKGSVGGADEEGRSGRTLMALMAGKSALRPYATSV
jgi:hypothetical protein